MINSYLKKNSPFKSQKKQDNIEEKKHLKLNKSKYMYCFKKLKRFIKVLIIFYVHISEKIRDFKYLKIYMNNEHMLKLLE